VGNVNSEQKSDDFYVIPNMIWNFYSK
jgi:hypothetical protein